MKRLRKTSRGVRAIVGAIALSLAVWPSAWMVPAAQAQTATQVSPNLMIILGNSYSMNREMDNVTYPSGPNGPIQTQCPADISGSYTPSPVFANDPGCGGSGTPFPNHLYGNQPSSKLYIAKQVLYSLLTTSASNNINFGFATYRQAFGLQLATVTQLTSAFWVNIYPLGTSPQNPIPSSMQGWTTSQLNTYGSNPDNFAWVDWWPGWDNTLTHDFYLGNLSSNSNAAVNSFSTTADGLPLSVQYPSGTQSLGYSSNGAYYYGSGGLDLNPPVPGNTSPPDANFVLCKTYYNSQGNNWQGEYTANNADGSPRMVVNTYPGLYNASTVQYIYLGSQQFDSQGKLSPYSWQDTCSEGSSQRTIEQSSSLVSDVFKTSSGTAPAYFSYIPQIYDQVNNSPLGTFTGWSGAASYNPNTNQYTANYPSGPQSSSAMGSYNVSGAPYMGAFVDLPTPSAGYVDQRSLIENLVNPAYPQWDDSGLGYDPSSQTIVNNGQQQSISASDYDASYDPHQEPVYDSLMDAAAYFSSYKKADPFDDCRTNAVLLIYDGHEDAHYTYNADGTITYADPSQAAAALAQLGVKTYVVIISNNAGDIAQANAIAQAGGTNQAFQVSNASSLFNAIKTVFLGLQGDLISTSPALPVQISSGSLLYVATANAAKDQGHVYAYSINANGSIANPKQPNWDAATQMNATNRTSGLYSSSTAGSATLLTQLDAAAFNLPNPPTDPCVPNTSVIMNYTINPSYTYTASNGQTCSYLGNRPANWFLGSVASTQDLHLFTSSASPNDLTLPGYLAFAQNASKSRTPALLYTSEDGFLYSSNAQTGGFNWGWMPRASVANLQYYQSVPSMGLMNGRFTIVDAYNGATQQWATYVVGNNDNGAGLYELQLSLSGAPQQEIFLQQPPAGATLPTPGAPAVFNLAGSALNPQGYSGVSQIAVEVVNTGTAKKPVNTLIEWNIATGTMSQATIPSNLTSGFITSRPFVDTQSGQLYLGDVAGNVYVTSFSGNANTDAKNLALVGTTQDQAAVHDIGIGQIQGSQYILAATTSGVTVFGPASYGYGPIWATNPTGGYVYTGTQWVASSNVAALQHGATVSDAPTLVDNILIVPVSVPENLANVCGVNPGSAYDDYYNMIDGTFPQNQILDANGNVVTGPQYVGAGAAYSPSVALANSSVPVYSTSSGSTSPSNPVVFKKRGLDTMTQWRSH